MLDFVENDWYTLEPNKDVSATALRTSRSRRMTNAHHRVVVLRQQRNLDEVVYRALEQTGILARINRGTRVALKPNLTYPFFKKGVTTSPRVIESAIRAVKTRTDSVVVVECDGGYGAWKVEDAFRGHGLYEIGQRTGAEIVSLHCGPRRPLRFRASGRKHQLLMPTLLLDETDVFITMPVPKVHCMTGLTLAHKNQWGCIPDDMRLRRHFVFNEAILAINEALRPAVLADGTFFLDRNGPMEGDPVAMNLIIGAADVAAFDRYVSELMGWSWRSVPHLRHAAKRGRLPKELSEISYNAPPSQFCRQRFRLERSVRNWIALSGFRSRTMTWFGYESWFGREVLHRILYAIVGNPPKPVPEEADSL